MAFDDGLQHAHAELRLIADITEGEFDLGVIIATCGCYF